MENLLLTDIKMLKQALLNKDVMQSLTASENMFEQVQSKMNRGEQVDSLEYQQVRNSLQEKKGLQEIVSLLESIRNSGNEAALR
jgi:ethanolamine utilization protein EutQ (cupin superfamily)